MRWFVFLSFFILPLLSSLPCVSHHTQAVCVVMSVCMCTCPFVARNFPFYYSFRGQVHRISARLYCFFATETNSLLLSQLAMQFKQHFFVLSCSSSSTRNLYIFHQFRTFAIRWHFFVVVEKVLGWYAPLITFNSRVDSFLKDLCAKEAHLRCCCSIVVTDRLNIHLLSL